MRSLWRPLAALMLLTFFTGCPRSGNTGPAQQGGAGAGEAQINDSVFDYAIGILYDVETTDPRQALETVVARLNEWIQKAKAPPDWQPDPMIETIPPLPQDRKLTSMQSLGDLRFRAADGLELKQLVVLREVARQAAGKAREPLDRATAIFDWTIRNVQLERDDASQVPHLPFENLLLGRGTAVDRAWLFALLARQEGLNVVMLGVHGEAASAGPDASGEKPAANWQPWLPALFLDGQLYLFDTRLGLPVPGPDRKGVATLAQAADDPAVLKQLDLDAEHPYPTTAAQAASVIAWIEASPLYLARRMQLVERELAAEQRLVMSVNPSDLAKKLRETPHVAEVALWPLPYQRMFAAATEGDDIKRQRQQELLPLVWPTAVLERGRILHLMGIYSGEQNASRFYRDARPAEVELQASLSNVPADNNQAKTLAVQQAATRKIAKMYASYWLGLMSYDRGNYDAAVDFLRTRTLDVALDGPWTAGARYNLGRTYEKLGRNDEAIALYDADTSPQEYGNHLRAKWLKEQAAEKPAADASSQTSAAGEP